MALTILDILGFFGNSISIVFFFIPILIIVELCEKKDTSKIPWLLFLFTTLNCEFWTIYGIKISAWPIYFCNGVGVATNLFYLIAYLLFLDQSHIRKLINITTIIVGFLLIILVFHFNISDKDVVGGIACVMNVLMFASPLQNLSKVYQLKDNSFIPIHISICLVINCIIWSLYGALKSMDYFVMIPNIIGLFLSLFQIYLWFEFRKPESLKKEEKLDLDQEELSNSDDELKGKEKDNIEIQIKTETKI